MLTAGPPAGSAAGSPRCAVLGSPIGHSQSPVLHRAAYQALGLDWRYDAYEVDPGALAGFVTGLGPEWRGLSLTSPLKLAAVDLCDSVSEPARGLGVVNTMLLGPGRREGHNTDVAGIAAALRAAGVSSLRRVLVIGSGATARSALAAAAELGAREATVLARNPERAAALEALGGPFDVAVTVRQLDSLADVGRADLVVSTVPAEAQRALAAELGAAAPTVLDVTYHPRHTPLLMAAAASGARIVGGFEVLLYQAAGQVELMTGVPAAPLEQMRAAGLAALGNPAAPNRVL